MKILKSLWIPVIHRPAALFGIVCIENDTKQLSVRVGVTVADLHQRQSSELIAEHGSKLSFDQARAFFPELITKENFKFQ